MRGYLMLSLALLTVVAMIYAGWNGIQHNYSYGFFFVFVGVFTTVGLALDVINHLRTQIRRDQVRKLGR